VVTAIAAGYREASETVRQAVITLRRTAGAVRRTAHHPGRRTCYRQGVQRPAEMVRVSEAFSSSPSSDHIIAPPSPSVRMYAVFCRICAGSSYVQKVVPSNSHEWPERQSRCTLKPCAGRFFRVL
jgi:hypothetical protein